MLKNRFKSVAAASFGNALEWYDFGVYTFVAGIISKAFFPPGDDAAALLATFAVFGLGFVVRPIGAAVLGRLGDVIGRKIPLVISMGLMGLGTLTIGFIPTYASNSAGLLTLAAAIPVSGYLSDRIGRKPLLIAGFALVLVLAYPLFYLLGSGIAPLSVLMVQILIGFIMSLYTGPSPATLVELFPTRARSTYMAIGYTMATATFGGFAPFIATWLISYTASPLAPTFYVALTAVISLATAISLRETAHEPLK